MKQKYLPGDQDNKCNKVLSEKAKNKKLMKRAAETWNKKTTAEQEQMVPGVQEAVRAARAVARAKAEGFANRAREAKQRSSRIDEILNL